MSYHIQDYSALDGGPLEYSNGIQLPSYGNGIALGQEYSLLQSILVDGGTHFGVSTVCFDSFEELLWMGNQGGHMTSYSTAELHKYTSFQIHVSNEVRAIVPHEAGMLSLTSNSLRMSARRGLPIFNHCSEQIQNMQCMVLTPTGTLLMGGHHKNLIELDLNTLEEINVVQVNSDNCAILRKHPRFICSGDINGKVTLHDPNTLSVEHTIDCHTGMLSDFDVHGNQLVTCGFSARRGELSVDQFLKVYDLRVMKSMSPIPMMFPPLLLRFVPAYSSRLCVVSQTGQFQMVDTDNSDQYALFIHQVETGGADILTFDTSSSCQAFAFGDAAGYLHLYGASNEVQFNQFNRPTEFADSVEPFQPIDINDEITPLSIIPMPHCEDKLLSDLPPEFCQVVYRPTPPIDPLILNSMKMVRSIGYAPNPGNRRRNQVPYQLDNKQLDSPVSRDDGPDLVPNRYLKQEIKYTKMGLDEIDFNRFNQTSFSGLEANLPNSYCNNMIQILYFIEPLRSALLSHLCQREFCLSCELGFLFHMLDTAEGLPCQAANFLRAFRTIPEASAHGLIINDINESKKKENLPTLVQSWTRFMLQQLNAETADVNDHISEENVSENTSIMTSLFGAKLFSCNSCRCRTETCQETTTLLTQLLYPEKTSTLLPFLDILQRSLSVKQHITAWCDNCRRFTSMTQTKFLKSLPDILVLNCGESKPEIEFLKSQLKLLYESSDSSIKILPEFPVLRKKQCRYGSLCRRTDCRYYHEHKNNKNMQELSQPNQSWMPLEFKLKVKGGEVIVEDCSKATEKKEECIDCTVEENNESVEYELFAVVSVITDLQENGRDNIVSCIRVGPIGHMRHKGGAAYQWYLFNDFSIVGITAQEAAYLNHEWKIPCVLYYARKDVNNRHDLQVLNPVGQQVFREDVSLAARSGQSHITFTPLSIDEEHVLPTGQLVAMDAEFVTLNQEEAEIRSDGTRSTIRPSQMSVARISCVRGDGPLEGVPFIDDYISTQEQVVDYLTKFSGIQPGDLDASISSKHLTTLKATYQKLRFLIDTGVTFVGHGLKNDFRVINLVVPPGQVLDTVYLFQLPNKRMVSLRFLAWHFLDLKIQAETHDSIEDAKTALQLYKKYLELKQTGKLKEALKELYEVGRQIQWKVPGIDS
ncbi:PAN2-PAN3 deadenylation complex catalytic subunit PAN2-like [Argiope bruennichi]|uniref:PAN2-PAN3 deadenylation complex catalytic subunit PAN2-like n=1 Tax=Argiope bruennichi TaxID=94029 RepID=UPI0024957040|nr:PAN2-PAN3 deadenylation complex catalytic subunit PAN2-like [Argiope bruennichi]